MQAVRDKLLAAKSAWKSVEDVSRDKYVSGELAAGVYYSGAALQMRLKNKDIVFGYPKEGFIFFMDSVAVLKEAKNVDNAKRFQNFIMTPENAALISAFAGFANGVQGSEAYMPEGMKTAPEVNIPAEFAGKGVFTPTCPPEVQEKYTAIWQELTE